MTTPDKPFDLQRYVPSPEALREMGDDEADAALLREVLEKPEVDQAREALRAEKAGQHHPLVDALVQKSRVVPEGGTAAPPRRRKAWGALATGLALSLSVVLPAALVFVLFARPDSNGGAAPHASVVVPIVSVLVVAPPAPAIAAPPPSAAVSVEPVPSAPSAPSATSKAPRSPIAPRGRTPGPGASATAGRPDETPFLDKRDH